MTLSEIRLRHLFLDLYNILSWKLEIVDLKTGNLIEKYLNWIAWDDLEDKILEYEENWQKKTYGD